MSGTRERVSCVLLVLSLLLSHLPLSSALALTRGSLTPGQTVSVAQAAASGGEDCCASPRAVAAVVAVDACCAPPPPPITDACCGPTGESEAPDEDRDDEPCCPTGCKHCPRPCCSAPLALLFGVGDFTLEFWAASRADLPLPDHTCAAPESVFHPPRA